MELPGPKIKKFIFSYISKNRTFLKNLFFWKWNLLAASYLTHFLSPSPKNKKNPL